MPIIYYWSVVQNVLIPILLTVVFVGIILALPYRLIPPKPETPYTIFIFVFALLGSVVGIVTGSSREPVVGALLPALLTFITGFLAFAFGREALKPVRSVIPYCLLALLLTSVCWSYLGAYQRSISEESEYFVERWKKLLRFERVELELEKAKTFKDAGLPLPSASASSTVGSPTPPNLPTFMHPSEK